MSILGFLLLGLLASAAFTAVMAARIAARHPPQGQFVPVEGGHIHLVDLRPQGPPRGTILLLHGASGNLADMTQPLAPALQAAGFRVVAPDRPGHGWSDRIGGPDAASPAQQAKVLRAALHQIGVDQTGATWSGWGSLGRNVSNVLQEIRNHSIVRYAVDVVIPCMVAESALRERASVLDW